MNTAYRLYFTRQSLNQLEQLKRKQPDNYRLIMHHQLPVLCQYPLQGRLLLNRVVEQNSHEIQQLCRQLLTRFPGAEFREFCCGSELLLYLNYATNIYLLAVIPIQQAIVGIEHYWKSH